MNRRYSGKKVMNASGSINTGTETSRERKRACPNQTRQAKQLCRAGSVTKETTAGIGFNAWNKAELRNDGSFHSQKIERLVVSFPDQGSTCAY